ncbi:hypothetical protein HYS31_01030 [Candidatus Woesearchaeota archaeon]|nr:hypothetical protein [Candidatus Woesearchaeota archaeon]
MTAETGKIGTIDDLAKDPVESRLLSTLEGSTNLARDLQPVLGRFIGKDASGATADEVVKALYEPGPKGESPALASVLANYGIKSSDYQTLIAQYGLIKEELKREIVKDGDKFDAGDILRIANTIGARYNIKTLEAEPARLQNLASTVGVKPVVEHFSGIIKKLFGEAAYKAQKARLAAITTVQDLGQYMSQFYQDSFRQYSAATSR